MNERSVSRAADSREVPAWFVLGLVFLAGLLAYVVLWRGVARPGSFFGGDLIAYTSAADRLADTGTPYHPDLFQGPIVSGDNVPIGYFYPPVLAQIFLPLRAIPHFTLAIAWSAVQALCLTILLPLVGAGRSSVTWNRALLAIGFGLAFYPLQFSIFSGNVSGWLAIGIAISLTAGPRMGGSVAAIATAVKLLPLPMFVAALTDPRSRIRASVLLAAIVVVSVLLAPKAWVDFITILPNILRIGTATGYSNLSPAHAFGELGFVGLGVVAGWVVAIGFASAAILTGLREGYSNRVLAMAVFSVTFASSTLWDHYLGVLAPLILWAWPTAGSTQRVAITAFVVVATGLWLRLDVVPEYRVVLVVSLVLCSLAIATCGERVTSNPVAWTRLRAGSH
jgi:hypothetical protein